jgi:quercetin dioxygenase-like cupin family protein
LFLRPENVGIISRDVGHLLTLTFGSATNPLPGAEYAGNRGGMPHESSRRSFLQLPLAAAAVALASKARAANDAKPGDAARASKGFRVGANQDRQGEDLRIMGGKFNLLVSSQDSGGDLLIYDTSRQQRGGPALHRHHAQDEWFYVLRGEFIVRVGDDTLTLRPGDSAFAPRKIPHAFAMTSAGEGQMLVLFQPAGSMEHFFHEMSKLGPTIPQNQETTLQKLWADHGMEIVGPALQI